MLKYGAVMLGFTTAIILGADTTQGAVTYSFVNITNNDADDAAAGEAQLLVDVFEVAANRVGFTFYHNPLVTPVAMSICDIFFDDGTLLGIASIIDGLGVDFEQDANPGDLPGGGSGFEATAGFTADSEPPVQANGVNPGETLTIIFDLINGKTFADTIAALDGGVDLRIGIHVQGFANDGSESFVNNGPVVATPEPGTFALLALGGVGIAAFRRKKKVVAA